MRSRKFSIVVSDLHLGAGDRLSTGQPNPLEDFHEDDRFVELLRYYDRRYRGQCGEFVSNGDFFETLTSDASVKTGARMSSWEALRRVRVVVSGHPKVFDALATFLASAKRRVVFVTGNHDPVLHFRAVRTFLRRRLGGSVRFRRDFHRAGDALIEHGHRFEEAFRLDYKTAFVGNSRQLELPWGAQFMVEYILPLRRHHRLVDKMITPVWPWFRSLLRERPLLTLTGLLRFGAFYLRGRFSLDNRIRRKFASTFSILRGHRTDSTLSGDAQSFLRRTPFRALLLGHTHRLVACDVLPGKRYLNTGTWVELGRYENGALTSEKKLTYGLVYGRREPVAADLWEWTDAGPVRVACAAAGLV